MNSRIKNISGRLQRKTTLVTVEIAGTKIKLDPRINATEFKKFAFTNPQLFERITRKMVAVPVVVHVEDVGINIDGYKLVPDKKVDFDSRQNRRVKLAVKQALRYVRERHALLPLSPLPDKTEGVLDRVVKRVNQRQQRISTCRIDSKDIKLQSIDTKVGIVIWPIDIK